MKAANPFINRHCSKCGTRLRKGKYVYSKFSKKHYCSDLEACARRARKVARDAPPRLFD